MGVAAVSLFDPDRARGVGSPGRLRPPDVTDLAARHVQPGAGRIDRRNVHPRPRSGDARRVTAVDNGGVASSGRGEIHGQPGTPPCHRRPWRYGGGGDLVGRDPVEVPVQRHEIGARAGPERSSRPCSRPPPIVQARSAASTVSACSMARGDGPDVRWVGGSPRPGSGRGRRRVETGQSDPAATSAPAASRDANGYCRSTRASPSRGRHSSCTWSSSAAHSICRFAVTPSVAEARDVLRRNELQMRDVVARRTLAGARRGRRRRRERRPTGDGGLKCVEGVGHRAIADRVEVDRESVAWPQR